MSYDVGRAVSYAHKWAFSRNPRYYNFDDIGGDCTNFISQCLFAGCLTMNYTPVTGWYYTSLDSRSAAWTGVEYLYKFLVSNKGAGPFGQEAPVETAKPGDVVQLSFDGVSFSHSLFVVDLSGKEILIATHTYDSDNRPLSSYNYVKHRLLSIEGANR